MTYPGTAIGKDFNIGPALNEGSPDRFSRDDVEFAFAAQPILAGEPPAPWRPRAAIPLACAGTALLLSACMSTADTPELRRQAYLDCARDQGLTVQDGTIRTRSAADLDRLQACQAIPR